MSRPMPGPWRSHLTVEQAIFGLAGFTSILRSFGETTRSISSIGIAPSTNLISEHQGAAETDTILKANFDRPHIGHQLPAAVGDGDLFLIVLLEAKLDGDMLRNAQVYRARVGKGLDLKGLLVGISRIAKCERRHDKSHSSSL